PEAPPVIRRREAHLLSMRSASLISGKRISRRREAVNEQGGAGGVLPRLDRRRLCAGGCRRARRCLCPAVHGGCGRPSSAAPPVEPDFDIYAAPRPEAPPVIRRRGAHLLSAGSASLINEKRISRRREAVNEQGGAAEAGGVPGPAAEPRDELKRRAAAAV
ncbi:MAG: hypothetical protein LBB61_08000, partial [Treponema sp.]|nr:hypothetical protein [Treponema sp.]